MNPQDPLAELRDIHLPQAISWWPPAIGWWILAILCIALIAGALYWRISRHRALAYKREALFEFETIQARYLSHRDDAQLLSEIAALLKRTCITKYGREQSAGLAGDNWLHFLDQTGETQEFSDGSGRALVSQRFVTDPQIDAQELLTITRQWLEKQK